MGKDFYREPTNGETVNKDGQIVDPETSKIIADQPNRLVEFIHAQRQSVISLVDRGESKLKGINEQYQIKEKEITQDVAKIVTDPREKLLPGFTYSLIATMTGSILTRRRSLVSRMVVPFIFGLVCLDYTLPSTMGSVRSRIYQWERRKFPVWTKKQDEMNIEWNEGLQDARDFGKKVSKWWNDKQ